MSLENTAHRARDRTDMTSGWINEVHEKSKLSCEGNSGIAAIFPLPGDSLNAHALMMFAWRHRHAQGIQRAVGSGREGSGAGPVFWAPVCVSGSARRPYQGDLVGRPGGVPVLEASGARPVRLAVAGAWQVVGDIGATGDASGGH